MDFSHVASESLAARKMLKNGKTMPVVHDLFPRTLLTSLGIPVLKAEVMEGEWDGVELLMDLSNESKEHLNRIHLGAEYAAYRTCQRLKSHPPARKRMVLLKAKFLTAENRTT